MGTLKKQIKIQTGLNGRCCWAVVSSLRFRLCIVISIGIVIRATKNRRRCENQKRIMLPGPQQAQNEFAIRNSKTNAAVIGNFSNTNAPFLAYYITFTDSSGFFSGKMLVSHAVRYERFLDSSVALRINYQWHGALSFWVKGASINLVESGACQLCFREAKWKATSYPFQMTR